MYVPAAREVVDLLSGAQNWLVLRVDYFEKTADLVSVAQPDRKCFGVPFASLMARKENIES